MATSVPELLLQAEPVGPVVQPVQLVVEHTVQEGPGPGNTRAAIDLEGLGELVADKRNAGSQNFDSFFYKFSFLYLIKETSLLNQITHCELSLTKNVVFRD